MNGEGGFAGMERPVGVPKLSAPLKRRGAGETAIQSCICHSEYDCGWYGPVR